MIVKWTGIESLTEMTGLSREAVIERFTTHPVLSAYEIGACGDDEFTDAMLNVFGLDMAPDVLKAVWKEWVGETYSGTHTALNQLRASYTTACLSNTNAMNWERLRDHIITGEVFDHAYASHLLRLAKPDPAIYTAALEDMGVSASDVWFFDDTHVNIEAAEARGIKSFWVDRSVGVLPILDDLGLLEG